MEAFALMMQLQSIKRAKSDHPDTSEFSPLLQRKYDRSPRKRRLAPENTSLQSGTDIAPPIVHEVLRSLGQSLDASTSGFMEPSFEHDFSHIPVLFLGKITH